MFVLHVKLDTFGKHHNTFNNNLMDHKEVVYHVCKDVKHALIINLVKHVLLDIIWFSHIQELTIANYVPPK